MVMMEIKQRVANILRFLSMAAVVASLLFMYAYGTDEHTILPEEDTFLSGISKNTLFYAGLSVFAVFNLVVNWGIKVYRAAEGFDENSLLFRDEFHKERNLFWLTLLLASVNILITSVMTYIAFIKIDGPSAQGGFLYMPIVGGLLLLVSIVGTLTSIFRKK